MNAHQPRFDFIEQYKYRLYAQYVFVLPSTWSITYDTSRHHDFWVDFRDDEDNVRKLIFKEGYCWDGNSSIAIDAETCFRASLVHDGGYQLLRSGVFGPAGGYEHTTARRYFDNLYRDMCIEDGMPTWRANLRYRALRLFGGSSAD